MCAFTVPDNNRTNQKKTSLAEYKLRFTHPCFVEHSQGTTSYKFLYLEECK